MTAALRGVAVPILRGCLRQRLGRSARQLHSGRSGRAGDCPGPVVVPVGVLRLGRCSRRRGRCAKRRWGGSCLDLHTYVIGRLEESLAVRWERHARRRPCGEAVARTGGMRRTFPAGCSHRGQCRRLDAGVATGQPVGRHLTVSRPMSERVCRRRLGRPSSPFPSRPILMSRRSGGTARRSAGRDDGAPPSGHGCDRDDQ